MRAAQALMMRNIGGYGTYTTAWYAQVLANGGTATSTELTALTVFENSMGSDLAEFDRLVIMGMQNSIAARTSFVNPSSTMASLVNSPTFTAGFGYTPNGTNSYINANYNPSTNGVKYVNGNFGFGVYYRTANTDSKILIGNNVAGVYIQTNAGGYVASFGAVSLVFTGTKLTGLLSATINSGNKNFYQKGILKATAAGTDNIVNAGFSIGAYGNILISTSQLSAYHFSSGAVNQANFNSAIQTLGTTLGWAV